MDRLIGVFGGTFDPPHVGHLILASEAAAQLGLDQVCWVLTPNPPHKQGQSITPLAARLDLLQAAIADNPLFQLSRVEIDRPPPHFAADTMEILNAAEPQAQRYYLMGGDSLRDLPTWRDPARFLAACAGLGVLRRPGAQFDLVELDAVLPSLIDKIRWVDAPQVEISATRIRQLIRSRGPYRYYLTPAVYTLIQEQGLYQAA
jgi:nicotinate-nucleotide adenylyltransferase